MSKPNQVIPEDDAASRITLKGVDEASSVDSGVSGEKFSLPGATPTNTVGGGGRQDEADMAEEQQKAATPKEAWIEGDGEKKEKGLMVEMLLSPQAKAREAKKAMMSMASFVAKPSALTPNIKRLEWKKKQRDAKKKKHIVTQALKLETYEEAGSTAADPEENMSNFRKYVRSARFDQHAGAVVVLNALFMANEYQLGEDDVQKSITLWQISDLFFLAFYTIEVFLRVNLRDRKVWFANPFTLFIDVAIIIIGFFSEIYVPMSYGTFMSNEQIEDENAENLKIVRCLRVVRVIRMLTIFDELRRVWGLFQAAVNALLWPIVFQMLVIFLFGMFSVVLIGREMQRNPPVDDVSTTANAEAYRKWYVTQDAVKKYEFTHLSMLSMFRIAELDGAQAFRVMAGEPVTDFVWTYVYFIAWIGMGRILLNLLIRVTVLRSATMETAAEEKLEAEQHLRWSLNTTEKNMGFKPDPADPIHLMITKEDFIKNIKRSPGVLEVFVRLSMTDRDVPLMYEYIFDISGDGTVGEDEFFYMYTRLLAESKRSDLVAACKSAWNAPERIYHLVLWLGLDKHPLEASKAPEYQDEDRVAESEDECEDHEGNPVNLKGHMLLARGQKKLTLSPLFYTDFQMQVASPFFGLFFGWLVIVNALVMAYEYEIPFSDYDSFYKTFLYMDLIFLFFFTVELMARWKAFGTTFIFTNSYMILDFVIVFFGFWAEIIIPLMMGTFLADQSEGAGDNAAGKVVKTLKVLRVARAIRVLRMLSFFKGLRGVVTMYGNAVQVLIFPMGFLMVVVFIFTLFNIVLIGRQDSFSYPKPVDSGQLDFKFKLKEWQDVVDAKETMSVFNKCFLASLRMIFYLPDTMITLLNFKVWTYAWFIIYVAITRMVTVGLLTAVILEKARKASEPEVLAMEVERTAEQLDDIITFMAGGQEGGQRTVSREQFLEHFFGVEITNKLARKLTLHEEDLPAIWELADHDGGGSMAGPEICHLYFMMKQMSNNLPLTVGLTRCRSHEEKKKMLHEHWAKL